VLWRTTRRAGPILLALGVILLVPPAAEAQSAGGAAEAAPATLSLADAIALAQRQSPDYLVTRNDERNAAWAVREAYGQLLPSASMSTGFQYQAPGTPQFGIYSGSDLGISRSPSYYYSSWSFDVGYTISGAKLFAPKAQRANQRAATARTAVAGFQLETDVTAQYLAVLEARDALSLAREQLASATENLRLAQARVQVGSAIELDAKQAQVQQGRAQVAVLQAENQVSATRLNLSQTLGVELPQDVQLTSTFQVFTPTWNQSDLLNRALTHQPQLIAAAAQEVAAQAQVRAAQTAYLPSLSFRLGWSGNAREAGDKNYVINSARASAQSAITQCELLNEISAGLTSPLPNTPADCNQFQLTPAQEQAALDQNNAFPFRFTRQPWSAGLSISLPIFNGLSRQHQLESARVAAEDAQLRSRAQALAVRTAVANAYATLMTARQAYDIEVANKEAAAEQLTLEQERYRVGSSSFIDLQNAQTTKAQADKSYLDALYGFHNALAVLQNAVGEKLATPTDQ
jgi:outer membrane protein